MQKKTAAAIALGALAGVGVGIYDSVQQACREVIRYNDPQPPIAENVPVYEKYYQVYRGLYPALKENYKQLAAL